MRKIRVGPEPGKRLRHQRGRLGVLVPPSAFRLQLDIDVPEGRMIEREALRDTAFQPGAEGLHEHALTKIMRTGQDLEGKATRLIRRRVERRIVRNAETHPQRGELIQGHKTVAGIPRQA